jgi:hypothetical protein
MPESPPLVPVGHGIGYETLEMDQQVTQPAGHAGCEVTGTAEFSYSSFAKFRFFVREAQFAKVGERGKWLHAECPDCHAELSIADEMRASDLLHLLDWHECERPGPEWQYSLSKQLKFSIARSVEPNSGLRVQASDPARWAVPVDGHRDDV